MKKHIQKHVSRVTRASKPEILTNSPPERITNQTVAEHREEVLKNARRFIYPLRQSKHTLVRVSVIIFVLALTIFFTYCTLALYKFKDNSIFLYKVTQVIPFPIARTGSSFVSYENYLFEINHYTHYYKTQQELDLNSDAGKQQINEFKKRALEKVINDAYVKQIAKERNISVSEQEVDARIALVRSQNRLGSSDKEFQSVLREYWDWSEQDFRRSLKSQILSEKVVSSLDTQTHERARKALADIQSGKDFATVASEYSDDPVSKAAGGDYGFPIDDSNRDIEPRVAEELRKLKAGETSDVIEVGYGLEIVKKVEDLSDGKIKASHIAFAFKNIDEYLNDIKDKKPARTYVTF
jgi:parvulin-like peptidyl-prolyl isomerase